MPLYVYQCLDCNQRQNVFKKLAQLDRLEVCGSCESLAPMRRVVTAAAVVGDYQAYDCPITGNRIEGRRAHEENLKKHGCRVYEPGETEQLKRRKADEEARFDQSIEATVDEFITTAPTEKREALAAAEQMGLTAEITRG